MFVVVLVLVYVLVLIVGRLRPCSAFSVSGAQPAAIVRWRQQYE